MRIFISIMLLVASRASVSAEPSAEQLYEEGQRAFDRGEFGLAIARWQSAYELSKLPLLVLNIAQAYRFAGNCEQALSGYRLYVALDPTSDKRGLADGFVAELEPKCGSSSQQQEDRAPKRPGATLRVAGLTTGGVGVATVITGLWLGHRASSLADEVTRDCAVMCDWAAQKSKDDRGRRYAKIGYALDAVGAVAIAGGIVMYYLGDRQRALSVAPERDGVVVSWSGAW